MKSQIVISVVVMSIILLFPSQRISGQKEQNQLRVPPKREIQLQWESLRQQFPKSVLKWDTLTGNPREISQFATIAYVGTPEERTTSFLKEHSKLLGIKADLSDLRHIASSKTAVEGKTGIDYIRFGQFYENLPVKGAETVVHLTETGKVFRVYQRYYSDIQIANQRRLSREEAIDLARKQVRKPERPPIEPRAEMIVFPLEGKYYYAWQIQINSWRFYIDAETGAVLFSERTILFQNTGHGDAYEINVCVTPDPIEVLLPNLDNSGYLRGTNFDAQTMSGSRAQNASYYFKYGVADPRFDQVEVYYQLEKAQAHFTGLGFTVTSLPTIAYANHPDYICNAAYNWGYDIFKFGIAGSGGCEGAICFSPGQDGDIIFHEYGHQVIHQTAGFSSGGMMSSIHEALADYFSCSYFDDPCLAEPHNANCSTCLRNVDNDNTYPNDVSSSSHITGLILSGAMWDIREALGQQFADWVALEGVRGLPVNPDFSDYAQNVLAAGATYFGDIDNWIELLVMLVAVMTMQEKFCDHGIEVQVGETGCP